MTDDELTPRDKELEEENLTDEELTGEEEFESFLPFNAINEFMRSDYRLAVVRSALQALPNLPGDLRAPIDRLTRQVVSVPGFRNSAKAPLPVRARAIADKSFEKQPELVAAILSAWAEAHDELRQQVYDLLTERGWELLPVDADRRQLPGFWTVWPAGEDFETLNQAYAAAHPDSPASSDDVSLMVVWLSVRLPYSVAEEDDEEE